MYNTKISVIYTYGIYSLIFSKTINLPFVPFFGLSILIDDDDFRIELNNDAHCRTLIDWNLQRQWFKINVRVNAELAHYDVDGILKAHADWEREDDTHIEALKELINQ